MRLYLTSYRLGDHPEDLVELVGSAARFAVVANAGDGFGSVDRPRYVEREIDDLVQLGFSAEELDLRDWFDRSDELAGHLASFGAVWVKGGNTFVLRRAFRQSGFDEVICDLLARDAIVYAGYSAGACVATPSLRGIEPMDEPGAAAEGYHSDVIWDGLALVPFQIVPHWRSDHPETAMADTCIARLLEAHEPFVALRDGETLVVDGEASRVTPCRAARPAT